MLAPGCPEMAKFRRFGKNLKGFGQFNKLYLAKGKLLYLLCQIFMLLGNFSLL